MNDSAHLMSQLRASFSSNPRSSANQNSTTASVAVNTTQGQLAILDQVLTEIEGDDNVGVMAQVAPQAALAATDTLNPTAPTVSLKEAESNLSPVISPAESGAGLQQVEYEQSPELSPEVESFLHKVENQQNSDLNEVVIADGTVTPSTANPPVKKPVVVLPITQEEEKSGQKKPLRMSIRWLVEWSRKLMKMFAGEVIYRE